MKKNVERRERTVVDEVITYVANDGTVFKSEEECNKYEDSAECAIRSLFNGVKKHRESGDIFLDAATPFPSYEDDVYMIYLESIETIEAVNKWLDCLFGHYGAKLGLFSLEELGTTQLVTVSAYDPVFYIWGDAEKVKDRFCSHIDEMVAKAKGEFEKKEDK